MITDFLTLELGFVLVPLTKMGMAMRTFNTKRVDVWGLKYLWDISKQISTGVRFCLAVSLCFQICNGETAFSCCINLENKCKSPSSL